MKQAPISYAAWIYPTAEEAIKAIDTIAEATVGEDVSSYRLAPRGSVEEQLNGRLVVVLAGNRRGRRAVMRAKFERGTPQMLPDDLIRQLADRRSQVMSRTGGRDYVKRIRPLRPREA